MRQNDRHLRKPRVSALLHAPTTTPLPPSPPRPPLAAASHRCFPTAEPPSLLQVGADRLRSAPRSALRNSTQATHRRQPSRPRRSLPRWSMAKGMP